MQQVEPEYIRGSSQKDSYGIDDVEATSCLSCSSDNFTNIYKERGSLGIVKCSDCGMIYTNPKAKGATENYIGDKRIYFSESHLLKNNRQKHHRDRNYRWELKHIKRIKKNGRLLDIGSNIGRFTKTAEKFGFDVEGVEASPALAELSKEYFNLFIHTGFFQDLNFQENSYDVITMIDVFEHIDAPKLLLDKAYNVLKKDGVLVIKVPNGNYSLLKLKLARMFNKESSYDIFDSFEHLGHYTKSSMANVLSMSNFKISKMIIPIPVYPPVWPKVVGQSFAYPSPFFMDWKNIILRNMFYWIGKIENFLGITTKFSPDLMFIITKV